MVMIVRRMFAVGLLSGFVLASVSSTLAQRPGNQQQEVKAFNVKGTITGMRGDLIQWVDENQRPHLVKLDRKQTQRITVTGSAEPSFLRPGLFVRFTTTLDEQGNITEPAKKLTIFSPADGFQAGVFPEDPANPSGPMLVAGQIKAFKNETLTLLIGRKSVKVDLAEEPEITIEVSDLRIVSPGDHLEVHGIGLTPEQIIAKTVDVELANPLTGPKKRRR